jgi:hypothetical protein
MDKPQTARLTALRRIQRFLDDNPAAAGAVNQSRSRRALDAVVRAVEAHAVAQHSANVAAQSKTEIKSELRRDLRVHHMLAIATIARAKLNGVADTPLMTKFTYPKRDVDDTALIAAGEAMAGAAGSYRQLFIDEQLPGNFIEQLQAATEAVQAAAVDRDSSQLRGRAATAGLAMQLVRAKEIVRVLNALVIKQLKGRDALLAVWKSAKRVHHRPGPVRVSDTPDATVAPVAPLAIVAPVAPLASAA